MNRLRNATTTVIWNVIYATLCGGASYLLVLKGSASLHGLILTAVSLLFIVTETVFWKLSDSINGIFATDVLNTRQVANLEKVFRRVRRMIRGRFIVSVCLRLAAGVCAAILLKPEVLAEKYVSHLWVVSFCGYFLTLLALPTLIIMVRSFSDAGDLKRSINVKESLKKRSEAFQKCLHVA